MAEESKEKLKIRLHVYDTEIAVNVVRDDEEYYRKAAKLITDTVNTYADIILHCDMKKRQDAMILRYTRIFLVSSLLK